MKTDHLIRQFSEEPKSVHYSKPVKFSNCSDCPITDCDCPFYEEKELTELQPDFEVKALVDPKHFDMIYNSGATETLNKLQAFLITYMNKTENIQLTALDVYRAVNVWANNQRTTLNKYL